MSKWQKNHSLKIDLHSHSTYSDGTDTPDELIDKAVLAKIDVLALTDHDTIKGIDEAKTYAMQQGIKLISGVEISCQHELTGRYGKHQHTNKIIHIVGLDFIDENKMNQTLTQLQHSRASRGQKMVEKLANLLNIDQNIIWQHVLNKANHNPQAVGRAHIAQTLYDMKVVKTVQQAFDKYLADNKPAYVAIDALTMAQGIQLIHQCGGQAVLAHPTRYRLSATRTRRLISDFAQLQGDACELPENNEPLSTRQMVDKCISIHQLKVSVGSDFHGQAMPWRRLGYVPKLNANQIGIWEDFR